MSSLKCISPVDNTVYVERKYADSAEITKALQLANQAQRSWKNTPVEERQRLCTKAVDFFVEQKESIAEELVWQMGRPRAFAPFEVNGFEERARHMIDIADQSLQSVKPEPKEGFNRYIKREPLGVVFVVAPWNFPYLTSVNAIIPALLAGNSVISNILPKPHCVRNVSMRHSLSPGYRKACSSICISITVIPKK